MFLFLIASGLSLIFGVLRVLNFAHGSFYMLGAYGAYQFMRWLGPGPGMFWVAALGAALGVAVLGGLVERLLLRHLYAKEELYQLLCNYALAIVPGMDTDVIVDAFVVVVIGGLGFFWGTFLGALVYGQVLSFGILFFPRFSIFAIFALMAAVLILRPWGLLGRPLQ